MRELKNNLTEAIKKIEFFLSKNCLIKNTDLIEICREYRVEVISNANETHLIHEILETAINQSIVKNFDRKHLICE